MAVKENTNEKEESHDYERDLRVCYQDSPGSDVGSSFKLTIGDGGL